MSFSDKMCMHTMDYVIDHVVDYIIDHATDLQDKKLKIFNGNKGKVLAAFVEEYLRKAAEIKNDVMKFDLLEPGLTIGHLVKEHE